MEERSEELVDKIKQRFVKELVDTGNITLLKNLSTAHVDRFVTFLKNTDFENRLSIIERIIDNSDDDDLMNDNIKRTLINFKEELMEISKRA